MAPAGRVLLRWHQRGILTPREPQHWGHREFYLARHFLLLQATSGSLAASVDYFDPDHNVRLRRPDSGFDHRDPDLDRATLFEIRQILGDDAVYRWLCACALYPQLQWDVTLQLGAKIGPDLLRETNLEKLVRLPWFRRGSIPVSLQQALAESLDAPERLRLRAAILELFEQTPPPPAGPAGDAHRLEIAIQRLDILPEERRRILNDEAVARVVAEADMPPGALIASPALRRALFPHGLPGLGFRAGARRALALFGALAIACVVGSAWYSSVRQHQRLSGRAASGQSADQGGAYTSPAAPSGTGTSTENTRVPGNQDIRKATSVTEPTGAKPRVMNAATTGGGSVGNNDANTRRETDQSRSGVDTTASDSLSTPAISPQYLERIGIWQLIWAKGLANSSQAPVSYLGFMANERGPIHRSWNGDKVTTQEDYESTYGTYGSLDEGYRIDSDGHLRSYSKYCVAEGCGDSSPDAEWIRIRPSVSIGNGELLLGNWQNRSTAKSILKKLSFSRSPAGINVSASGQCAAKPESNSPEVCDWGPTTLKMSEEQAIAVWNQGGRETVVELAFQKDGVLRARIRGEWSNQSAPSEEFFVYAPCWILRVAC
jgi:hypothetical protein